MGVRGYEILELSNERGIPAIMLTAHALSPDHLVKSLKEGAQCYLPKDKMADISDYLSEVLQASEKGVRKSQNWFDRIKPYFDK
jgi:CheY-like chemotaxis protein